MKKLLLILILQNFILIKLHSQSFNVRDLVALSSLPVKNVDHFLNKKGFIFSENKDGDDSTSAKFVAKVKQGKTFSGPQRSIDISLLNNSKYFTLHTSSIEEYLDGQRSLENEGFFYDDKKDITGETSMLFQKGNIAIQASTQVLEGHKEYSFKLKAKAIPDSVVYAEDLLQFDSHEFLTSFFGEQNVKKDMYYFSEKELRKCSVLFSGSRRQVVFVWADDINLNKLEYILVTNILPTEGAALNNPLTGNNEWQVKNGIHAGMPIKDLLRINEMDFDIYGNRSDLAFMVKPETTGKIDFNTMQVLLSCSECLTDKIFNQREVSALDVAKANLPMRVNDVILYAKDH